MGVSAGRRCIWERPCWFRGLRCRCIEECLGGGGGGVVVVVFVIVLEAGLSSSITIIVGSFRHRMLTLRIISSRRCCSAVGLGRYAKSFVFLYRVRNSSAVQLNGSPSRSVGVIARRSITTSCSV